ncbi:hypothetical protein [Elizabethkingia anophelis]|uniref:hypothetical protein n=1 Tax=Elizabethkingia anophelis TaxID=1117645 RepID=UPI0029831E09|nr:hypothetical protein [Elizabethkingia anophelis]HAY3533749.1 hypothetical protein [Elizabethkingia anophelis]HAY3545865.1 hypothetical protein [Elizabethkingia anophelis]HAY3590691.1 hypothetical protein [Elizabethkingia anophelis]
MNVDLNNLRMQAAFALDDIIKTLNNGILPERELSTHRIDDKWKTWEGDVLVFKEDIQNDIDHLRSCVWALLCCFEENNPEFRTVFEDVDNNGGLAKFNSEE